jgi:hypothetical protein
MEADPKGILIEDFEWARRPAAGRSANLVGNPRR